MTTVLERAQNGINSNAETKKAAVTALFAGWIHPESSGGGSWIRTNVDARSTDLQSASFNHSDIPPKANCELCRQFFRLSSVVYITPHKNRFTVRTRAMYQDLVCPAR